ncbi:MAG: hypothetical protein H5T61_15790, partial [Thermoflexales bacterium]|nr:hypothetical protein [Thermoflexales bacterium]
MSEVRHIPIPVEVVNDGTLTAPLFRTYVQLLGLAWEKEYRETPALRAEELMEVLGCSERSLRGHLAELEGRGLIEVRRRAGRVVIRFPERRGRGASAGEEGAEERQSFAESGKVLPESANFCRSRQSSAGEEEAEGWQSFAESGKVLPESADFCRSRQSSAGEEEAEGRQSFAESGKVLPGSANFCRNRQTFAGSENIAAAVADLDFLNNSSNNNSSNSGRNGDRRQPFAGSGRLLPEGLREKLRWIGFSGAGPMRELEAAWQRDPERVEGWVEYVLEERRRGKSLGGGYLLQSIRSGEPAPPDPGREDRRRYIEGDHVR